MIDDAPVNNPYAAGQQTPPLVGHIPWRLGEAVVCRQGKQFNSVLLLLLLVCLIHSLWISDVFVVCMLQLRHRDYSSSAPSPMIQSSPAVEIYLHIYASVLQGPKQPKAPLWTLYYSNLNISKSLHSNYLSIFLSLFPLVVNLHRPQTSNIFKLMKHMHCYSCYVCLNSRYFVSILSWTGRLFKFELLCPMNRRAENHRCLHYI
jgi:hypothetical protein